MQKVRARAPTASLSLHRLHGGYATYLPGETLGRRTLQDYELVWIINGKVAYHANGRELSAPPGAIILARPGFQESYTWDRARTTRHAYFHFSFDASPPDWPPPERWPICRVMTPGDPLRPLFRHVVDRFCIPRARTGMKPTPSITRAVETLIGLFIEGDAESPDAGHRPADAVGKSLDYAERTLAERPDSPITLSDMARAAQVSEKHLCRVFAHGPGVSPMRAVRLLRLEQGAALLARSSLSIKQIAERSGFANQFHFSRAFRQAYGAAPSEARSAMASGALPPLPRIAVELPHVRRR